MKKLICIVSLLLLGILVTLLILSKTRHITEELIFYTIPKMHAYRYEENKRMKFELFGTVENCLIEYTDENQYFIKDTYHTFPLLDVQVEKRMDYQTNEELYYKYIIFSKILSVGEDISLRDCQLVIENQSFTISLEIGDLRIYTEAYEPLNFTDLYGNYAYIENELHLIGITVQLSNQYQILYDIKVGEAGCLFEKIEKDILYDSQRNVLDLGYEPICGSLEHTSYSLNGKYGYYYFPIVYQKVKLINEIAILFYIDGTIYSIDDFLYLANDISLKDYPNIKMVGKVTYA